MKRLCPLLLLGVLIASVGTLRAAEGPSLPDGLYAEIGTPRGTITCELFFAKTPLTVASFVGLAEGMLGPAPRKPFFDGLKFHRVVPDFVVQGGDPDGTGEGGPGYKFPDEFIPELRHDAAGVLSMANDGPDTNGSQFFLTLRETNRLNYLHSVFGRVVRGLEVLPQIQQGDAMTVKIVRRGVAANAFHVDESVFQNVVARTKKYSDVAAAQREPGPAAHFDDPDKLIPTEPPRAKNFNYKLANFERATGVKIIVRLLAKTPADERKLSAHARDLAQKLGAAKAGAVAYYAADRDEGAIWIGDDSVRAFLGAGVPVPDLGQSGSLHEPKTAFFHAAKAKGDADYEKQKASAPADRQPPPAQRLKLQVDAVIDGLISKLEPK